MSTKEFREAAKKPEGKLYDFLARIDYHLTLRTEEEEEDRKKARVSVAIAMLRKHFGTEAKRVQLAVLDAIARASFKGNNRSIDQLIMMSSRPAGGVFSTGNLPDHNLAPDIDIKGAEGRFGTSFIEI